MNYREWLVTVPEDITADSLWKMEAYRLALFSSDVAWQDVSKLSSDARTRSLADQLYRAVGSIAANLSEGYSRSSGRARARFYEYALGSAREARGWYFKGRHLLKDDVVFHRIHPLTEIIRLVLVMVPDNRELMLREETEEYGTAELEYPAEVRSPFEADVPF